MLITRRIVRTNPLWRLPKKQTAGAHTLSSIDCGLQVRKTALARPSPKDLPDSRKLNNLGLFARAQGLNVNTTDQTTLASSFGGRLVL